MMRAFDVRQFCLCLDCAVEGGGEPDETRKLVAIKL